MTTILLGTSFRSSPGGGDDRLLVNLHARERRGFGARGEDDVLGADRLRGAVLLGDDHLAGGT